MIPHGNLAYPRKEIMPLKDGSSEAVISANVAELVSAGWPRKQAVAIAEKRAGKAKDQDNETLAGDSMRSFDANGHLHVAQANISKANVCPYYGREIPRHAELGLDPDRVYYLYRHPDELAKAAETFNNTKLLDTHVAVSADDPHKEQTVGSLGTDAVFEHPYLKNSLVIWDADAIQRVESGAQKEISSSYRYRADMTPGEVGGERYDGIMRDIVANHVALVETGRAGPDVVVGDAKPANLTVKETIMAYTPKVERIAAKLKPLLAADADIEDVKKAVADDEDETDEEKKKREEAEREKKANDEAEAEKKKAEDEEEEKKKEEDGKKAMDAAIASAISAERKRASDASEARSLVRPLVGEVIGMDSAEDVLRYALKQRGVAHDGVNLPGLKALVASQVQAITPSRPVMASDSAAADLSTRYGVKSPRKL